MAPLSIPLAEGWAEPVGWLVALCGVLGIGVGLALSRWVEARSYRLEDEQEAPRRAVGWWFVPALGALWALLAWRIGDVGHGLLLPAYLYLAAVGITLVAIDLDVHRLPDPIVLPSFPILLVLLVLGSWGTGEWGALVRAVIAAVVLLAGYFLLALFSPGGSSLGLGDVKLAGLMGLVLGWLGWWPVLIGIYAGFILGGVLAVVLLVTRRRGLKSFIAYGPPIIVGAFVGVLLPVQLVTGALTG